MYEKQLLNRKWTVEETGKVSSGNSVPRSQICWEDALRGTFFFFFFLLKYKKGMRVFRLDLHKRDRS